MSTAAIERLTHNQVMPPPPQGAVTEAYARDRARAFAWLQELVRMHLMSGRAVREIFPSSRSMLWRWTGNPLEFAGDDVVNQLMTGFLHFRTELELVED